MVLGQSKTDPTKYVAMKVVYLRSPDVLDDPEHLAILRRLGLSGWPHLCIRHCTQVVLPEQECSVCFERPDVISTMNTSSLRTGWAAHPCPSLPILACRCVSSHRQIVSYYSRKLLRAL